MKRVKGLRWWIAGLLALATALNYLDRQSFPVVQGEIRKEIPISDEDYGLLSSLFLLAYAIMYAGGGRVMDRIGTRLGYAVMIVWWSAANLLTGTVSTLAGLGFFRFLLGMGEGGGFPGSGKAVAEWFPPRERGLAFGIFNAGSSLGAVIAPPLISWIVSIWGWRWVFYITGSIGFLWAWIWLTLYDVPARSRFITDEERETLNHLAPNAAPATGAAIHDVSWFGLFTFREVQGLMAAKFLTDAAWYCFIFWLPRYLQDVRGLDIKQVGYFAWIPYAAAGVGSLSGGYLGGELLRRGYSLNVARKTALAIGAALMPASALITSSPLNLTIVLFSTAMFAHQFWSSNVQTVPADLFPAKLVGSVEGLLGSTGAFGGMLFGLVVGKLVSSQGYGPVFVISGLLHPLAFLIILGTVRMIEPVQGRP